MQVFDAVLTKLVSDNSQRLSINLVNNKLEVFQPNKKVPQ